MNKRQLLTRLLAATILAGAALPGTAQTKLKFAHLYETSHPYHRSAIWAAEELKKRTAGRYELQVFPASTLGKQTELNQGLIDAMAQTRPMIVEVMLMSDEALSPKVAAIPQADGSMTSMPLEDMSPLLPLEVLEAEMDGRLAAVSRQVRAQGGWWRPRQVRPTSWATSRRTARSCWCVWAVCWTAT